MTEFAFFGEEKDVGDSAKNSGTVFTGYFFRPPFIRREIGRDVEFVGRQLT